MITVLDPLFKPTLGDTAISTLDDTVETGVKAISSAMGYSSTTEIELTTASSTDNTAAIKAINDNFYKEGSKFIIPILLEKPTIPAGETEKVLGATIEAYNVSYLVISPKCLVPIKPYGNTTDYNIYDNANNKIYGSGTASGELSADQVNFNDLRKPTVIPNYNGTTVESAKDEIEVAGTRLVNYRLYRSATDAYPITFDDVDTLVFGYKATIASDSKTAVDEFVITSYAFSLSLIQQVMCVKEYSGKTFPVLPTDYKSYTVTTSNIKAVRGGDSNNAFLANTVPFNKGTTTPVNVGLALALLTGADGIATNVRCCHIHEKIYLLKSN